jgi:hypothetical protein
MAVDITIRSISMIQHVFLIGAMKCGTNTLYHALKKHPHVKTPEVKELDYFLKTERAPYADHFRIDEDTQVLLDGTTQYSKHPAIRHMPDELARAIPGAKIIYLMRDPIARVESNIAHHIAREEGITLANWRGSTRYRHAIHYSRYYTQIGLYCRHFAAEHIFLGIFEEFISDQLRFIERVCEFLELVPDILEFSPAHRNPRRTSHSADALTFSAADDMAVAKELGSEIDCLVEVFSADVDKWWSRYRAAQRAIHCLQGTASNG